MQPSDETSFFLSLGMKIAGLGLSFVAGIVTATWVVATKVKGFDDRLRDIESVQDKCPGKTLAGIDAKIEAIPERIEAKMDGKFDRVHERIDEILLRDK